MERIDYAFTGALAASFYGIPRTTAIIDIIVAINQEKTRSRLAPALRSTGLMVDIKTIDDAYASGFKVASFKGKTLAYRVDIIFVENIEKRKDIIADIDTWVQAPENLINAKLRMIKVTLDEGKAAKDESDIMAILRYSEVNKKAIEEQAKKDQTLQIWKRLAAS